METGHRKTTRLGVIADTHGFLRPQVIEVLRGADRILHAGDVGKPEILERLRSLAPVSAVRGNVDVEAWSAALPQTEVIQIPGHDLYMLHNLDELDLDPAAAGFAAVIYGHSHRPAVEWNGGVLYLNPGSCGPRRFSLPISLAILNASEQGLDVELIELGDSDEREAGN
ncbi:MAG TPA: metallophosphoesterase family protein [Anaerolineaceae bacterium]|nr:metallophosphoesterase family protein [Anaerolineaceae bacterium]